MAEAKSQISLEDVIAAAGQGATRALKARELAVSANSGFYIDVIFRCGIPAVTAEGVRADEKRRGTRPDGGHNKD